MKREKIAALFSFLFCVCLVVALSVACGGEDPKKAADQTGKIGGLLKTDDFEITVISAPSTRAIVLTAMGVEIDSEKASEGAVFVVINYRVKNISDKPVSVFSFPEKIVLIDSNDTVYEEHGTASSRYRTVNNIDGAKDLNPGIAGRNAVAFEVAAASWNKPGWRARIKADKTVDVVLK